MWKNPWKINRKDQAADAPNPAADGSLDADLKEAAAETEAQHVEEVPTQTAPEPSERLTGLPDEIGAIAIKGCFFPLARFSHPAWMPTDEEIAPHSHKMVVLLEAVLDRVVPQLLKGFLAKYPEAGPVVVGMAAIGYQRFKIVRVTLLEEAAARREQAQREAEARVSPIEGRPEPVA